MWSVKSGTVVTALGRLSVRPRWSNGGLLGLPIDGHQENLVYLRHAGRPKEFLQVSLALRHPVTRTVERAKPTQTPNTRGNSLNRFFKRAIVAASFAGALAVPAQAASAAPVVTGGLVNVTIVDVLSGNQVAVQVPIAGYEREHGDRPRSSDQWDRWDG